ncbi:MAG: alpha/beta hydrolase [Aquificaceae bacterium]|nr:alpha/beta hydrolase [Aquificaceae bacterium]MDW8422961.1 alpha/beta hydrolase [Aquificaceae bacterium]
MLKSLNSVELPFHGRSSLTYTNLWDLAKVLAIGMPKGSYLVGWSLGASIALMMAYLFPDRFRGLLLIGACACFGCLWPEKNLRGFMLKLEREGEEFLREFRHMAYPKPFQDTLNLEGAKRLLKDYMKLDIRPILPYIKQKVTILHGTGDPITPFSSAITLYNMLRSAKLITFAGGHFPKHESLIFEILKGL